MAKGHVAKLDINVLLLKHPAHKFENFEEEVQYIINHDKRNNLIKELTLTLKGNTLVLFARVEGHGQPLYELINSSTTEDRNVFFIHGGVDTEDREKVREITDKKTMQSLLHLMELSQQELILKISIMLFLLLLPNQEYVIYNRSVEYSEGNNKTKATLYDIADDISYKSRKNYTLNHLIERIKVYNEENFNYDIVNIPLKN